jgi:hypothetical protein
VAAAAVIEERDEGCEGAPPLPTDEAEIDIASLQLQLGEAKIQAFFFTSLVNSDEEGFFINNLLIHISVTCIDDAYESVILSTLLSCTIFL